MMKIIVSKQDDDVVTKFLDDNGETTDFDYIMLINSLFSKCCPEIVVDGSIDEIDRKKIEEMYREICKQAYSDEGDTNND